MYFLKSKSNDDIKSLSKAKIKRGDKKIYKNQNSYFKILFYFIKLIGFSIEL